MSYGNPRRAPEFDPQRRPRETEPAKPNPWKFFEAYTPTKEEELERLPQAVLGYSHVPLRDRDASFSYLLKLQARTREREKRIERERGPRRPEPVEAPKGELFEAFLAKEIGRQHWFGGEVTRTTMHDDWYNGVDAIIEWPAGEEEGAEATRLAVDFTIAESAEGIRRKLETLNGPAKVKYFRSKIEQNEEGKPKEMRLWPPKIVVGLDLAMLKRIAQSDAPIGPEHPAKIILLQQARDQLRKQITLLINRIGSSLWHKEAPTPEQEDLLRKFHAAASETEAFAQTLVALPSEQLKGVISKPEEEHLRDLLAVKQRIDQAWSTVNPDAIDGEWAKLMDASLTHRQLGGGSAPVKKQSENVA